MIERARLLVDAQKQDRIEQMIADLKRYKKIDMDLSTCRQKIRDVENDLQKKIDDATHERDRLDEQCRQLTERIQQYEQWKREKDEQHADDEQLAMAQLEQDLNSAKSKNERLQQRHCKIMEQLNKLRDERKSTETVQ
jgi:chromosome segregation ATPase